MIKEDEHLCNINKYISDFEKKLSSLMLQKTDRIIEFIYPKETHCKTLFFLYFY
jgi:hypothetical protein